MASATPSPKVETFEDDLDAILDAAKGEFAKKKDETKAARGRVRQITRRRRHQRRREITETITGTALRVLGYTITLAGVVAFGIALVFLVMGNLAAALTLFTVAGAAWGTAAVRRR
ncbi:hypothetical protein N8I84_41285 (plasmid) [Streptomyces cynarae]|uniref:DUF3040 domain-containing protein n=1 Tax=Streptomyces cynarae TaxID=2981134 RepID=A0ABY6EE77_9ACTN|nr:hypothetical protein [Streptomyces cynarae]UXY24884.1 hypothetical protein N8I84_41285 [Streptomyces cynarae]